MTYNFGKETFGEGRDSNEVTRKYCAKCENVTIFHGAVVVNWFFLSYSGPAYELERGYF